MNYVFYVYKEVILLLIIEHKLDHNILRCLGYLKIEY